MIQNQIKELRVRIDGLVQLLKPISPAYGPVIINMSGAISEEKRREFIKEWQKRDINNRDFVIHPCDNIKVEPIPLGISHLDETIKSLLLAKAWYGKMLSLHGEQSPYQNDGKRKEVSDIEPTADRVDDKLSEILSVKGLFWKDMNYIQKVDYLREEITKCISSNIQYTDSKGWFSIYALRVDQHLCEARFHLGFELGRIKEQSAKAEA